MAILGEKLNGLNFTSAVEMYSKEKRIDFKSLGREKIALFLTISDTDRSMDRLISLFYTQALHELCNSADMDYPNHRLKVPVRFILDDFATNAYIPNFDNITSVIRSREIYVSIILQSITQLKALYGDDRAKTIINNCDNCLYLGGQDVDTAQYMSVKANKSISTILNMDINDAYLFTRGTEPQKVEKYDIKEHERYNQLAESQTDLENQSNDTTKKGVTEYGI
jgi:type IV secretion system protein VirD4